LFHRWRVRAPLLMVLGFNGKENMMLSSVKMIRNLQLGSFHLKCICQSDREKSRWDTIGEHTLWGPLLTAVVVARQSSCLIRHHAPFVVILIHSLCVVSAEPFRRIRQSIVLPSSDVWSYVSCT
jgi:hypothetical protein